MAKETRTCCAETNRGSFYGYEICGCKASVERDGKWYCKRHDPVAVAARDEAKATAWETERARKATLYAAQIQERELTDTLICEAASGIISGERLQELAQNIQATREKIASSKGRA